MSRRLTDRLSALSREMDALRLELSILDEQVAFQRDVTDDVRVRALVAETPLADRELRVAVDDLGRMERVAADTRRRLARLEGEQDRLLAEVSAQAAAEPPPV